MPPELQISIPPRASTFPGPQHTSRTPDLHTSPVPPRPRARSTRPELQVSIPPRVSARLPSSPDLHISPCLHVPRPAACLLSSRSPYLYTFHHYHIGPR